MVRCIAPYLTKDSADTRRAIHLEDSVAATRRSEKDGFLPAQE